MHVGDVKLPNREVIATAVEIVGQFDKADLKIIATFDLKGS